MSEQSTLIYIEQENKSEAEFMSRSFVNSEIKNRAYLNALGAELMIHYLKNEGIDASDTNNLHSVSKVLEDVDISDILLPNIHIDVRVIFDDSQIFIPQQQFSLGLAPDVYAVLKLSQDFTNAEFIGYFEPKLLNPKNKNSKYYFIEKEKLASPDTFKSFVEGFRGNTSKGLSQEEIFRGRELSVLMADHCISAQEKIEFFKLLLASSELRESVLEFDNFETLSYSVGSSSLLAVDVSNTNNDINPVIVEGEIEDNLEENIELSDSDSDTDSDSESDEQVFQDEELLLEDDILSFDNEIADKNIEEITSDDIQDENNTEEIPSISIEQEDLAIEVSNSQDISEQGIDNDINSLTLENVQPMDITDGFEEDLLIDENLEDIDTSVVETTITQTLDVTPEELPVENVLNKDGSTSDNSIEKGLGDAIAKALKKTAETAAGAAAISSAGVTAVEAAEAAGTVGASAEAMKLAGISGELVSDLVNKNIESQQANLDKIDYAKTKEHASTDDIPEHIAVMDDLSTAKLEANIEAEVSGKFDTPRDLSELRSVQTENSGYGDFEHETIDFSGMETVELDEIREDVEDIVNLNNIASIDSPTKPVENQELQIPDDTEFLGMEMPNLSSYTINEDGSSPFDEMEINLDEEKEEHLVDFNMNSTEFNLDSNIQPESVDKSDMLDLPPVEEQNLDNLSFDDNEFDKAFDDDLFGDSSGSNLGSGDNTTTQDSETKSEVPLIEPVTEPVIEDLAPTQETVLDNSDEISAEELFSELGLDDNTTDFLENETEDISLNDQNTEPQILEENNVTAIEPVIDEEPAITEEVVPEIEDIQIEEPLNNPVEQLEIQNNFEPEEEFVQEQEAAPAPVEFDLVENSRIISDKNFTVGEIPIDINNIGKPIQPGPEQLGDLYDDGNNITGTTMLNNPGTLGKASPQGKKGLGVLAVVLTLIIIGAIGFAVSKMMKPAVDDTPQPITDEPVPMSPDNGVSDVNTLNVDQNNVVNMDNTLTQPVVPAAPTVKPKANTNTAKVVNNTPVKANVSQVKKSIAPTAFLEVKKLSWEVPDYVSYNQNFKQYFQSAGKSLKLSLTSDLLLATEPAYSNQIRVTVTFAKDGAFKDARILLSSGSAQIDNIVLQTVNQTLKVLKAPNSIGNDESTTVILKIYL